VTEPERVIRPNGGLMVVPLLVAGLFLERVGTEGVPNVPGAVNGCVGVDGPIVSPWILAVVLSEVPDNEC